MNDDNVEVGDILKYNGYLPDGVLEVEKDYIDSSLEIGKSYRIDRIGLFKDGIWYRVKSYGKLYSYVYAPKESFDIKFDIKNRYDLR